MREELTVRILRIDGEEESHILTGGPAGAMKTIAAMIGAANLDTINLRDGRVMIVDDDGYEVELVDHGPGDGAMGGKPGVHFDTRIERRCVRAKKPVNKEATRLYYMVRGVHDHAIVGDVAIVLDEDFRDEDEP